MALITVLVGLHLIGQFSTHVLGRGSLRGFVGLFRLQSEHNIPAYFSGVLLLSAGVLLLRIGLCFVRASERGVLPWLGLGAIFCYMAVDEVFSLHERFGAAMYGHYRAMGASFDGLNYKWVVTGAVMVAAVVVLFFRFWLRLPGQTRLWCAIAAVVFVTGAIGFETLSGQYALHYNEGFGYAVIVAFEEGLEMAGVGIFILTLMRYQDEHLGLHIGPQTPDDAKPPDDSAAPLHSAVRKA